MAKRPPPGLCVHCLGFFDELTWDHVFPRGWYPETTSSNLGKWKIPSCLQCNALHAESEGELLVRLGLCVDPDSPDSAGIADKALRALNPSVARDSRDARARGAHRQTIFEQSFRGVGIPTQGIYPGFGFHPGVAAAEQVAFRFSRKALNRLAEKIVRGITYLQDRRLIKPPCRIELYALDSDGATPVREILKRWGQEFRREPGIAVRRTASWDEFAQTVYEIEIWHKLYVYASVGCE